MWYPVISFRVKPKGLGENELLTGFTMLHPKYVTATMLSIQSMIFFTRCHTGAVWTARPELDKWLWDSQDWSLESWIGIGTDARLKHVFNFPRAMSFNDLSRDYCTHGERLAMWSKILFAHPQRLVLDHGIEIPLGQRKISRVKIS